MIINVYDVGDLVRIEAQVTDLEGNPFDPGTITFSVKTPSGSVTSKTYGVDPEVSRLDTGLFKMDIDADEAGNWFVRVETTGAGKGAEELQFRVRASQVI